VYLILTITIGIVSGLYTSSYLSRMKVLDILKNSLQSGKGKQIFRSILIIVELVIFCTFVSGTLIIRSQYKYAINKDPGHNTKDILLIDLGRDFKSYSAYINSISADPGVITSGGVMDGVPMEGSMSMMIPNFQDESVNVQVEGLAVDYNFIETMGFKILDGRSFSRDFGSDLNISALINETAVKRLGITNPVGKKLAGKTIIGVVKDFNLHSIHSDIPPLMIDMTDRYINHVAVHLKPGSVKSSLTKFEAELKKISPDRPFRYLTIEDIIKELYSSERNLSLIVSIFAVFTLIIAASGLFGLTLFIARSRTREIGIKKAYGSSESAIVYSFLLNNLILVITASLLSIPLTLHFMQKWLNNFAFKTDIKLSVFLISFAVASVVVLLTVFIHSYRASRINPVKALRYE
jgi:putative ABC transport system permease protein